MAYEERMAAVYAAADLVVCRAGAMTVAELAVAGVPAVLVPLPGAPGDHQTANARVLERAGAGGGGARRRLHAGRAGRGGRGPAGRSGPPDGHGPGGRRRWGAPTPPTPAPGWSRRAPGPRRRPDRPGRRRDRPGPARDLGDPTALPHVHMVGVGGAGMSAIATVLAAMGHEVTGSDLGSPA